jgi:hypothetical protein
MESNSSSDRPEPDTFQSVPEFVTPIGAETSQQAPNDASGSISDQFRNSKHFRRHCIVAALASLISFALWLLISFGVSHLFIFPIWVVYMFSMTLSIHYFLVSKPRQWLKFHESFYVFTNIACVLTWMQVSPQTPWFAYVATSLLLPLAIHRAVTKSNGKTELLWNLHLACFSSIMLLLLVVFLATFTWPWLVIVLMVWAPLLFVHARKIGIQPNFLPVQYEDIEALKQHIHMPNPSDSQPPSSPSGKTPLYPTLNVQ